VFFHHKHPGSPIAKFLPRFHKRTCRTLGRCHLWRHRSPPVKLSPYFYSFPLPPPFFPFMALECETFGENEAPDRSWFSINRPGPGWCAGHAPGGRNESELEAINGKYLFVKHCPPHPVPASPPCEIGERYNTFRARQMVLPTGGKKGGVTG